jgi:hypothetical protein
MLRKLATNMAAIQVSSALGPADATGSPNIGISESANPFGEITLHDPVVDDDDLRPPGSSNRKDRKRQLRRENRQKTRREEVLAPRDKRAGFDFKCSLCPKPSYFNRNGILLHL